MDTIATSTAYDLVIVGGSAGGLSVAVSSLRSGLGAIRIVESGSAVAFPDLVGENQLDVGYGETVTSIETHGDDLVVTTNRLSYRTTGVLIADRRPLPDWRPSDLRIESDRVLVDTLPDGPDPEDVLVVGFADHAVELTATLAANGHRVVLAAAGMDPTRLSPAGDNLLRRLEHDRRAAVLYRLTPSAIGEVDGFPMAYFANRDAPDLQFDRVVIASPRETLTPADVGATDDAVATGRLWFVGEPDPDVVDAPPTAPGWRVGEAVAAACFPDLVLPTPASTIARRQRHRGAIEELRAEFYNATITAFEPIHDELWTIRVRPDFGDADYIPGQYATLGLGYWEPRIDEATDPDLDQRWDKLVRRSYSISNRMFDEFGYLNDDSASDELEFYIVLVTPTDENIPALTPRLILKRPGDSLYLGAKVAGRYTLAPVQDPDDTVVFLATGTGEAPHNGMVVELLRKGHVGPIVSAVTVRQWSDLGYQVKHEALAARYPNYHYLPLPTREPDVPKRYIQSVIADDGFAEEFRVVLDPDRTHVYLCGNPAMIGLPEFGTDDDDVVFPEVTGVIELLVERGFTLSHRKVAGNIHYEEYW